VEKKKEDVGGPPKILQWIFLTDKKNSVVVRMIKTEGNAYI